MNKGDPIMNLSDAIAYPKWMVIQLVERCNLRCKMCYEWGESGSYHGKESPASLDYPVIQQVLSDCLPARPYFEFFGGEPLLYPRVIDVVRLIRQGGSKLEIPTNGILVETYARELVEAKLNRLWVSLDGPEEINDQQRGQGVFQKAVKGINKLYKIRKEKGSEFPQIGISYTVTPLNHTHIEELFLNCLDLAKIDIVIFTFQLYATMQAYHRYVEILGTHFGIGSAPQARGIVQDPAIFADMDIEALTRQLKKVRDICQARGIHFIAFPRTIACDNIRNYFTAQWDKMVDRRTRCAFPWIFAEISARGDVTVCHSFYDLSLGNVYEQPFREIWRGERIKKVRNYLRKGIFPICTACCQYFTDPTRY